MATPATLADLREDVTVLAGLGLEPALADRYINEGHIELCVRSQWSKGTVEIGPGVANQTIYSTPSNLRLPKSVWVAGIEYENTDQATSLLISRDLEIELGDGAWWVEYGTTPAQLQIGLTSVGAGASIKVLGILTPDLLVEDDDEPIVPSDFRQAIVDYVAAYALGRGEDLSDERILHQQMFDAAVDRLFRLGNEREGGQDHAEIRIKGVHW